MSCEVWIIDDSHCVRESLSAALETAGMRVTGYASAEEFLPALPSAPPDCLLLDLQMPGMTGQELLPLIKQQHAGLPVIVITGHGAAAACRQCLAAGAAAVLDKPVDCDELTGMIRSFISR
jgi:FixJ family two-component response regulator